MGDLKARGKFRYPSLAKEGKIHHSRSDGYIGILLELWKKQDPPAADAASPFDKGGDFSARRDHGFIQETYMRVQQDHRNDGFHNQTSL